MINKVWGWLLLLVLASLLARYLITGGATVVSLQTAPPLSGIVAQSLFSGTGRTSLPVPGKDFSLKNLHYFNGRQWAVASVVPIGNNFDPSVVVLERQSGVYRVVLGPGSSFEVTYLKSLPTNVGDYLYGLGIMYVSSAR
jgi:hypothetical protein